MDLLSIIPGGGLTAALVAVVAAAFTALRIFAAGKKSERDKRAAERLKARTEADRIEDTVAGRDPDDNRQKLKEWTPWGKR